MRKLKKTIYKKISKYGLQYLVLITGYIALLILISLLRGYRTAQYTVLIIGILFYITWGIIHHSSEKTLKIDTVIEYILIGGVILFLLLMLIS